MSSYSSSCNVLSKESNVIILSAGTSGSIGSFLLIPSKKSRDLNISTSSTRASGLDPSNPALSAFNLGKSHGSGGVVVAAESAVGSSMATDSTASPLGSGDEDAASAAVSAASGLGDREASN